MVDSCGLRAGGPLEELEPDGRPLGTLVVSLPRLVTTVRCLSPVCVADGCPLVSKIESQIQDKSRMQPGAAICSGEESDWPRLSQVTTPGPISYTRAAGLQDANMATRVHALGRGAHHREVGWGLKDGAPPVLSMLW